MHKSEVGNFKRILIKLRGWIFPFFPLIYFDLWWVDTLTSCDIMLWDRTQDSRVLAFPKLQILNSLKVSSILTYV